MRHELSEKKQIGLYLTALFLVCALVYWPQKECGFILDGNYVVAQNANIKTPALYGEIFRQGFFDAFKSQWDFKMTYYRPVVTLTFALDYAVWKLDAFGYRLTNICIHYLNAVLVFVFLQQLFKRRKIAVLASGLFAVLPVNEWVVSYVVGRGDLLQLFFTLGALSAMVRYMEKKKIVWLAVSLAAFILGLLSKETLLMFPVFAALVLIFMKKERRAALKICAYYLTIAGLYFVIRQSVYPIFSAPPGGQDIAFGLYQWIDKTVLYYVRFILPWPVLSQLPGWTHSFWAAFTVMSLFCVSVLYVPKEEKPLFYFGLAWLAINSVAFFFTYPMHEWIGPYLYEHILYYPAIGFCVCLAVLLGHSRRHHFKKLFISFVLFYFIALSMCHNLYWRDEAFLLARVHRTHPDMSTAVKKQLYLKYIEDEQEVERFIDQAEKASEKSIWYKRLGHLQRVKGNAPAAIDSFQKALTMQIYNLDARNELAVTLLEQGKWNEGMAMLERSVQMDDQYYETQSLIGRAYYFQREYDKAIENLKKARELFPTDETAGLYLGLSYYMADRKAEYAMVMEDVLDQGGGADKVMGFLISEFFKQGYYTEARYIFENSGPGIQQNKRLQILHGQALNRMKEK